jgi:cytochrome c553
MLLSKKRRDTPEVVISICAQCHLRGGKSKSTGLPYPNQFVAGDNLFHDFQVNFALADDQSLNAGDRHVYRSARDVAVNGLDTTCLDCHNAEGPRKVVKTYTVRSSLCDY